MTTMPVPSVTFDEMQRLAESVAKSGLFGFKTADQALALMAIAQAEGTHPALAARDYHIVQGRPVLKADAMLARFQAAGGKVQWGALTDDRAEATFSHPVGGSVTIDWDLERAKKAGLAGRDTWKAYSRQMLRARVISEGIKTVYPGAVGGLLTPEEAADLPAPAERDITPQEPATGSDALRKRLAKVQADSETAAGKAHTELRNVDTTTGELLPAVTLVQIDAALAEATTLDALASVADLARGLPDGEREIARKAYAQRKRALEAA